MKKLIYFTGILFFLASCENFLDTENYTKKDDSNFPQSIEDMQQIVTGIYATLNLAGTNSYTTYYYLAELASDDRFGGGGAGGKDQQGFDKFMNSSVDRMGAFWAARYKGINRANYALEVIDQLDGYAVNQKEHMLREIHFLRGFFYHELAEAFENVPLVLNTEAENLPQADVEDLYGQITYDLRKAIEILDGNFTLETNRITKWDAEALMARVFLFYTGFYQAETLPLGDGEGNVVGSVTKDQVIAWLEDCVFQSDRKLLPNFRSLWAYTNPYTAPYYKYLQENDPEVRWAGDGTAENTEKMFSISHTTMATWNETGFSNAYALYFSHRTGGETTFPLSQGWGAGPVTPGLWNEWKAAEPDDLRREASIMDVHAELENYVYGEGTQMEETGLWAKKVINIQAYDEEGTLWKMFGTPMYGGPNDIATGNSVDLMVIRFADVLLMHSELKKDVYGINKVRERVGLTPLSSYSLEALQKERRWELCFESRRWADIRRWHIAEECLEKQEGNKIYNQGFETTMKPFGGGYRARYQATRGFFKIPETQITLSKVY